MRKNVVTAMRARGFELVSQSGAYIWFAKSRSESLTSAFCLQFDSHDIGFSLSFGIEHAYLREKVLADASAISPATFARMAEPPFSVLARPCINTFPGSIAVPGESFDPTSLQEELIDSVNAEFFEVVDSSARYLEFLKDSTGIFDWRRSAAAFRLLYVGRLFHSQGMTSAEFAEFGRTVPGAALESHMLVKREGWTAESFIEVCARRIWT